MKEEDENPGTRNSLISVLITLHQPMICLKLTVVCHLMSWYCIHSLSYSCNNGTIWHQHFCHVSHFSIRITNEHKLNDYTIKGMSLLLLLMDVLFSDLSGICRKLQMMADDITFNFNILHLNNLNNLFTFPIMILVSVSFTGKPFHFSYFKFYKSTKIHV